MKALLSGLFVLWVARRATSADATCNQALLQYYGLAGAESPQEYASQLPDMDRDFCPRTRQTCCTAADFNQSGALWTKAAAGITKGLGQLFSLLQVFAASQSLLRPFLENVRANGGPACQRIDLSFFRNPIAYDQVADAVRLALETFAYLQRGFYCMLCDADTPRHLRAGAPFGRLMVGLRADFCTALLDRLAPFLSFKFFYLDPMVINLNAVVDCANNFPGARFDSSYRLSYAVLRGCLADGSGCDALCNEFRLGAFSDLFLGRLSEYRRVAEDFQAVIRKYNPFAELPGLEPELAGPTPSEFFAQTPLDPQVGPLNTNLSRFDVLLTPDGLNPFRFSEQAAYAYPMAQGPPAETPGPTLKATLDQTTVQHSVTVEVGDKLAVMEANNVAPAITEVTSMTGNISSMDTQFAATLQAEGQINPNDVSRSGLKLPS